MAISTRRRDRSYPTPIVNFDDSGRESYIARSNQGITSLPSSIIPFRTSETARENFIARTQGGNKDRDFNTSDALYRLLEKQRTTPSEKGLRQFQDKAEDFFNPATSYLDPTADDYFLRELYNKFVNPIDPENEGLPMDEGLPLPEDFMPVLPPGEAIPDAFTLEVNADTYTLPNLLQMLDDARDAGNEDEIELLTNDLEMMYPGATTTI